MMQEILAAVVQAQRRSLVLDGSLSDYTYFRDLMRSYRAAGYQVEILFVFAKAQTMIERAERRASITGRWTTLEDVWLFFWCCG